MNLELSRNDVLEELSVLQGVVERRTAIPILSNILLEVIDGKLQLMATDLDMTITTSCPAQIDGSGRLTVGSHVFQELVRNLPEDRFTLRQEDGSVVITSGRFRSQMQVADASEYPTLPEPPSDGSYALPLDLFKLLISRVMFAITKDDPKFQLNGALIKLVPGEIEMAATDGHRLAVVRAKAPDDGMPFEQQLLPRKLLAEFGRFNDQTVVFSAGSNHLGFRMGDRHVISRVVELRFPQYERVILRDNPNRVRIGREELLGALRRVSLMAHDKARGVRLKLAPPNELNVVSVGYEAGKAEETLPVEYQGETLEITLNAAYMIDVLQVLTSDEVELQLRDSKIQCVLVPVEDDPRLEEYIYVLMPMRI